MASKKVLGVAYSSRNKIYGIGLNKKYMQLLGNNFFIDKVEKIINNMRESLPVIKDNNDNSIESVFPVFILGNQFDTKNMTMKLEFDTNNQLSIPLGLLAERINAKTIISFLNEGVLQTCKRLNNSKITEYSDLLLTDNEKLQMVQLDKESILLKTNN